MSKMGKSLSQIPFEALKKDIKVRSLSGNSGSIELLFGEKDVDGVDTRAVGIKNKFGRLQVYQYDAPHDCFGWTDDLEDWAVDKEAI